jgi:hypothetical protein
MTAEETPELHADLGDVLRMVTTLDRPPRLGAIWRKIALALTNTAPDVEKMHGLVIEGEVYDVAVRHEWAPCSCGDGRHEFRRDAPRARGHWHQTRRDAEEQVRRMQERRIISEPRAPQAHLVTHLVATTTTEEVR